MSLRTSTPNLATIPDTGRRGRVRAPAVSSGSASAAGGGDMEVDGMVVVTGAGGALGQALVTAYREAGADVIAVTRAPAPAPHPGVRYERADLTSEGEV